MNHFENTNRFQNAPHSTAGGHNTVSSQAGYGISAFLFALSTICTMFESVIGKEDDADTAENTRPDALRGKPTVH